MAKIYDNESGDSVVVKVKKPGNTQQIFAYDEMTASLVIANDSTQCSGLELKPVYVETITEQIERSKWLGTGIKLGLGIPKIAQFSFEKNPTKEVRKITKTIWRHPEPK
jgi:hypothetical protein